MAVACKQEQLLGGMPAFDCRVWHGINRYFDVAKHWWGLKVTELGYSGELQPPQASQDAWRHTHAALLKRWL